MWYNHSMNTLRRDRTTYFQKRNEARKKKCPTCERNIWHESLYCQQCARKGEKNPLWAGENVGYHGLHAWIKRHTIKPKSCESCHQEKRLDLANISQKYLRDLSDWEWLCRRCHMKKDGRIGNRLMPRVEASVNTR